MSGKGAHVIGASDKRPWFKAELHAHDTQAEPLEAQVEKYRAAGYRIVVYCAKDTEEPLRVAERFSTDDFLVIDGVEHAFRLADRGFGHVIGFPIEEGYRSPAADEWTMKEGYDKLKEKNPDAIMCVAHPHDKRWSQPDVTEAWREGAVLFELNSEEMDHGEFATGLWDSTLAHGARFSAILSNDVHKLDDIDEYGYVMLQADSLTPDAVFEALRSGAFYAAEAGCQAAPRRYEFIESKTSRVLEVEAPGAVQIRIVGNGGYFKKTYHGERAHHVIKDDFQYLRAEVQGGNGRKLFLQPVFLK